MAGFILFLERCVLIITFKVKVYKRWVRIYNGIKYNIIFIIIIIIVIVVIIIIIGVVIIIIIIMWGRKRERVLTLKRRT